jgi:hypothetical protein
MIGRQHDGLDVRVEGDLLWHVRQSQVREVDRRAALRYRCESVRVACSTKHRLAIVVSFMIVTYI